MPSGTGTPGGGSAGELSADSGSPAAGSAVPLTAPSAALPVATASDRGVWSAELLDRPTLAALRERALADLAQPWPLPLVGDFARYRRDGNRTEYESAVFARDKRLSRAAVMAAVTLAPDVRRPYLDLGAGEVVAQLAWIDHLLGAELDERAPGLRARIRHEADVRTLTPSSPAATDTGSA